MSKKNWLFTWSKSDAAGFHKAYIKTPRRDKQPKSSGHKMSKGIWVRTAKELVRRARA